MQILQEINDLSTFRPEKGVLFDLYNIVIERNISREQAVELFLKKGQRNFKVYYKRLKDKLLAGILENSFREFTAVQRQHIDLAKKYTETTILIQLGKKKAGIKIAEEVIRKAEILGVLEVQLTLCRSLVSIYATQDKASKKYQYYQAKCLTLKKAYDDEFMMERLYHDLLFARKHKKPMAHLFEQLRNMEEVAMTNEHYRFRLYYHYAINRMADYNDDQSLFLENTKMTIDFFDSIKTLLPYTVRFAFLINLVPIHLKKKDYRLTERTLNACLQLPNKGSFNWQLTLYYKCLYGFYSQNINMALNAYQQAHSVKALFNSTDMEYNWEVARAYLVFFAKTKKIAWQEKFKLAKFINSMPKKPSTEQRANMMVLEFLHLLADNKLKRYTQKTFNLDDTIYTHFNRLAWRRTKYMLKIFRAVLKGNFNQMGATRHALVFLEKLDSIGQDKDVLEKEIVPYEFLWEEVLEVLKGQ